jgi:small conductance mechanosensitive channel
VVSIAQASDLVRVRDLLAQVVANDERVLRSPAAVIEVAEIAEAAIKLHFRPWTSVDSYADFAADTMDRIKSAMDTSGLKFTVALQAAA